MKANEKNAEMVNQFVKILMENGCTIKEACSILDFTKSYIEHTSKVTEVPKLSFT